MKLRDVKPIDWQTWTLTQVGLVVWAAFWFGFAAAVVVFGFPH